MQAATHFVWPPAVNNKSSGRDAILGRIQQTGTLHGSSELFQVTGRDFTQGEPEAADIPPHQAKRGLYGDGVDLQKKRVDQIHICNLKLGSLLEASVQTQVCHIHHQLGQIDQDVENDTSKQDVKALTQTILDGYDKIKEGITQDNQEEAKKVYAAASRLEYIEKNTDQKLSSEEKEILELAKWAK